MTRPRRTVALALAGLSLTAILAGCGSALSAPAATPTASPTAPPEVPAAFRPLTATPSPTADIQATIAAAIQATRAAEPTATATPEPTATVIPPTVTSVPPTAKPAPKPPAATPTPAINPAERAYVAAWDAIKAEIDESMTRARDGGVRTGNGPADQMIGRTTRWKEYKRWPDFAERVTALEAPPRLRPAHALRVEAVDHLVVASKALIPLEIATGGMADAYDAQAHNNLVKYRELIVKATAESKKVGW